MTRIIALSAPHDLEGLIAWSRREEWREPFGTLLDRHAGKTCAAAGVALAHIGRSLGEEGYKIRLLDCALWQTVPHGATSATQYAGYALYVRAINACCVER